MVNYLPNNMVDIQNQILPNEICLLDDSLDIEKEMIIFSAVRSNSEGEIGLLKDPRRLNRSMKDVIWTTCMCMVATWLTMS